MPITILVKPASSSCNLQCDYCFYKAEADLRYVPNSGTMSFHTLKNLIRKTLNFGEGPINYAFQGGEPLLSGIAFYEEIIKLQKQYNKNGRFIQNSIQTNGTLINAEWAEFFKKNRFLIGISLDGPMVIHDIHRTNASGGSFENVMSAIELLRDYNVDFNILSVVTPDSYSHGMEIYSFFKHEGFEYIQFIPMLTDNMDKADDAQGFGQFLSDVFDCFYQDLKNDDAPYIRNFDNMIGSLMGFYPEACEYMDSCVENYAIEADGSVYPCDFYMTDEYLMGNVNTDNSMDLKESPVMQEFIKSSHLIPEKCEACEYFRLCKGGCRRYREIAQGNHYYCEGFKYFYEKNLDKLKEIAELKGKGFKL
jgi:uncharacterized protein